MQVHGALKKECQEPNAGQPQTCRSLKRPCANGGLWLGAIDDSQGPRREINNAFISASDDWSEQ